MTTAMQLVRQISIWRGKRASVTTAACLTLPKGSPTITQVVGCSIANRLRTFPDDHVGRSTRTKHTSGLRQPGSRGHGGADDPVRHAFRGDSALQHGVTICAVYRVMVAHAKRARWPTVPNAFGADGSLWSVSLVRHDMPPPCSYIDPVRHE